MISGTVIAQSMMTRMDDLPSGRLVALADNVTSHA